MLGTSRLWWGVLAAGLDRNEDLCKGLVGVDVLGDDLDLGGDGSLGVGKDRSLDEGVVGLGLGLGINDAGPLTAPLVLVATLMLGSLWSRS